MAGTVQLEHSPKKIDLAALAEKARDFPEMVVINATYVCNARCIHCPYTNSGIRKEERAVRDPYIRPEVLKTIADQVGSHGKVLRVSGAGEPFLNERLVEYVLYAKQVGCQVGVINNGSAITEEKALAILESGVEMLEFSVDAADPKTYGEIRKGLDFDSVRRNIEMVVALRDRLGAATRIIASVVNQKQVEDKITKIVEFWERRVDRVQVRKYLTWDINDLENSADISPYLDPEAPCPFPFDRMLTDTNGDVRFCVYDVKGLTTWGNVLETPLAEIWRNQQFSWLREVHLRGNFGAMEICGRCLDRQFRSWNYNYFYLREKAAERMPAFEGTAGGPQA